MLLTSLTHTQVERILQGVYTRGGGILEFYLLLCHSVASAALEQMISYFLRYSYFPDDLSGEDEAIFWRHLNLNFLVSSSLETLFSLQVPFIVVR